jgi:hypothetical protein
VLGAGGGWPSALAVAGALPFEDAFRLAQEVALLREDALSAARGGQVIYPLLDADWEPSADLRAAVADALSDGGQHPAFASVDLGGFAILAGDEPAVTRLLEQLPAVTLAGRRFPLRLAMQGPDHTPLAEGVAEVAAERLGGLRWLSPLPVQAVRQQAASAAAVLVVDECRRTGGGVADAIVADLAESGAATSLSSVRAVDSFVPLGPATAAVLVGTDDIVDAALAAVGERQAAVR